MTEATMENPIHKVGSRVLQGVHYMKLPETVPVEAITALIDDMRKWAKLEVHMHVMDFNNLKTAPEELFRAIQGFEVLLKMRNLNMLSINIDDAIASEIETLRLESTFGRSIERAKVDPNNLKPFDEAKHKKLLLKYLVNAAHEAVQVTLQSTVSVDENYLSKIENVPMHEFDLISVVNTNNEFLKAEFRLLTSSKVVQRFAHAMLGKDTLVDADLVDSMVQELLNMIYGHAKSNLNDKENFRLPSAIPKVLHQKDFGRIKRSGPTKLTILPMVTPMGSFYIEVDLG